MAEASELWNLARACREEGRTSEAIEYYERALPYYQGSDKLEERQNLLNELGGAYQAFGSVTLNNSRVEKGIHYLHQSLLIAKRREDRQGQAFALVNIGIAYHDMRRLDDAAAMLDQGLGLLRELGDRKLIAQGLTYVGMVQRDAGRLTEAVETLQQSVSLLREDGDRSAEAEALRSLGRVYKILNRFDEALDCLDQSRTIYCQAGDRYREAVAIDDIGTIYSSAGDKAAARAYLTEALEIFNELGVPDAGLTRARINML